MTEFELKNLEEKVIKALNSPFAGEIIFTNQEINDLAKLCHSYFSRGKLNNYQEAANLFVLFVNLTKENIDIYDDENQWLYPMINLYNEKASSNSSYCDDISQNDFYKLMREYVFPTLRNDGKIVFQHLVKKYQATFSCHALAPTDSMDAFFDFCWDILWKMEEYHFDDVNIFFSAIANTYKKQFDESIGDDGVINYFGRPYHIRIGLSQLADEYPDKFADLVKNIVTFLNDILDKQDTFSHHANNYLYGTLLSDWYETKKSTVGEKIRERKSNNRQNQVIRSKPTVSYAIRDNKLYLHISNFCLVNPDPTKKDKVECFLKYQNKVIAIQRLQIYEYDFLYCVNEIYIPIADFVNKYTSQSNLFLSDFSIEIIQNDTITLYDSEGVLYRDIIFFKPSSTSTLREASDLKPGSYLMYCYDILNQISDTNVNDLKPIPDSDFFEVNAIDSQYIKTTNYLYTFSDHSIITEKPEFFGFDPYVKFQTSSGEECNVVSGDKLYLRLDLRDDPALYILKFKSLSDDSEIDLGKLSAYPISKNDNYQIITLAPNLLKKGPYEIRLSKAKSDDYKIGICIAIEGLKVSWPTTLSFGRVPAEKASISYYINNELKEYTISTDDEGTKIPYLNGELIVTDPPLFKCRIGNSGWLTKPQIKDKWYYEQISNSDPISFKPSSIPFSVLINNEILEDNKKFGEKIHELSNDHTINLCDVSVIYDLDGMSHKVSLFDVYLEPVLLEEPIRQSVNQKRCISYTWEPNAESYIGPKIDSKYASFTCEFLNKKGKKLFTKTGLKLDKVPLCNSMAFDDAVDKVNVYYVNNLEGFDDGDALIYSQKIVDTELVGSPFSREQGFTFTRCFISEDGSHERDHLFVFDLIYPYEIRKSVCKRTINGLDEYEAELYAHTKKGTLHITNVEGTITGIIWRYYKEPDGSINYNKIEIGYLTPDDPHCKFDESYEFTLKDLGIKTQTIEDRDEFKIFKDYPIIYVRV